MREAVRGLRSRLAPGHDIVFIARGGFSADMTFTAVLAQIEGLMRRAGLFAPDAARAGPAEKSEQAETPAG